MWKSMHLSRLNSVWLYAYQLLLTEEIYQYPITSVTLICLRQLQFNGNVKPGIIVIKPKRELKKTNTTIIIFCGK